MSRDVFTFNTRHCKPRVSFNLTVTKDEGRRTRQNIDVDLVYESMSKYRRGRGSPNKEHERTIPPIANPEYYLTAVKDSSRYQC